MRNHTTPPRRPLVALEVAKDVAISVLRLLARSRGVPADLSSQLRRAVCSVALNIAEAQGRKGADRTHLLRIAYGSALEASTALELLAATGCLGSNRVSALLHDLDRVRALTWGLMHPRRLRPA